MKNKKRILLITWNYPPKIGGMENLLFELVKQIRSTVKVGLIAPHAGGSNMEQEEGLIRAKYRGLIWFFIFSFFKGNQLLRTEDYDVIVGGSALVTPLIYLLGKIHRKPTVIYAHGLDLIYDNILYQPIIRFLVPKLDLMITNSTQTGIIARNIGVTREKISVVHPGIKTDDFITGKDSSYYKKKHQLEGKFVLLYVGRLAQRKGIPEFIEHSLPEIVSKHDDVVFCVIGGNPEKSLIHKLDIQQLIEKAIIDKDVEEHVRLLGWVDRDMLIELYLACDLFILPAIYVPDDVEGFGIVLAEANAAGKPVVSTKLGGIQDAVANDQSGILVEPENWGKFSEAVISLIENENLRKALGDFGSVRVKNEFDWPVIGRKFLDAIDLLDQSVGEI